MVQQLSQRFREEIDGQVIQAMEEVADQVLQPGFGFEWTATAAEEKSAGGAAPIVFGWGFVMVFLVLAAQYESYVDPTIIMITVPLAIMGALGGIWLRASLVQPFDAGAGKLIGIDFALTIFWNFCGVGILPAQIMQLKYSLAYLANPE